MRARPLESDWSAAAQPRPDDRTDGRTADGCGGGGGRGRSAAARRIVGCRPARGGGKTEKWRRQPGRRPPGRGGGGGVGVRVEKGRPSLARAHTNGRPAAAVETAAATASCVVFSPPRRSLLYVRVRRCAGVYALRSLSVARTTLVHNKLHNLRREKKNITSVSFSPAAVVSLARSRATREHRYYILFGPLVVSPPRLLSIIYLHRYRTRM